MLDVKKLGPKAFTQCAGFLRIVGGDEPLDETSIHPESYEAARALMQACGITQLGEENAEFPEDKVNTEYVEKGFDPEALLEKYKPCCLISIERCGENINGDYANMRGVSIAQHTADIDRLFDLARAKGIYTVGIGDGGNEIGMGNLKEVISEELSLVPCKTQTTDLIIATVSNWGAYALAGAVSVLQGKNLFKEYKEVDEYIKYIVGKGSVDGVNKVHEPTVDGFSPETEKEIVDKINNLTNELISK